MDRFDLEQAITQMWTTSDDLDLLLENVLEGEPTTDTIANAIGGIKELNDMRVQRVFDIFSALIKTGDVQ